MAVCTRLFFLDLLSTMSAILSWLGFSLWPSSHPVSTTTTTPPSGPTRPTIPASSPNMSSIASEVFGIDAETGFLPREEPVRRLNQDFDIWERALQQAHAGLVYTSDDERCTALEKVFSEQWRKSIREMPILHTYRLESDVRQCRRAHLVLAMLVQQYVQSLPPRSETDTSPIVIPASLAIPFVAVSRCLGIAAIVTYADVCLWNWALIDPSKPISGDNIRILDLFTGSPQEQHFFLTSTRIEIRSWEALELMGKILKAQKANPASETDIAKIASDIASLAIVMDDVANLFETVRDQCDPHWFYFTFRPWIRGAEQGPTSPDWFYEGVDGTGISMKLSGPSAGQSAMMHAFDVFLDVVHPQTGSSGGCAFANAIAALPTPSAIMTCPFASSKAPAPPHKATEFPPTPPMTPIASAFDLQPVLSSAPALPAGHPSVASTPECEPLDTSFLARMRQYMPGTHADWLIDLKTQSIRGLVQSNPTLQPAYDSCILGLKKFRDNHIRVVARYVICPARSVPKAVDAETLPVRGTGGTSLLPLLKHYRDNTIGQLFGSYDP